MCPSFPHYLKSLMREVTITNGEVLLYWELLADVTSTNGLSSVKLFRIRDALQREGAAVASAFEEIDRRHARQENGGTPVVIRNPEGEPLLWKRTKTPAYDTDPEKAGQRLVECAELDAGTVTIRVPLLNEQDLAWITANEQAGRALAAFTESE